MPTVRNTCETTIDLFLFICISSFRFSPFFSPSSILPMLSNVYFYFLLIRVFFLFPFIPFSLLQPCHRRQREKCRVFVTTEALPFFTQMDWQLTVSTEPAFISTSISSPLLSYIQCIQNILIPKHDVLSSYFGYPTCRVATPRLGTLRCRWKGEWSLEPLLFVI